MSEPGYLADKPDLGWPTTKMVRTTGGGHSPKLEVEVDVPVIDHLDARVLRAMEESGGRIDMDRCLGECAVCVGGWYLKVAGKQGYELYFQYGTFKYEGDNVYDGWAPAAIFHASCPGQPTPEMRPWGSAKTWGEATTRYCADFPSAESWDREQWRRLKVRAAADPLPV